MAFDGNPTLPGPSTEGDRSDDDLDDVGFGGSPIGRGDCIGRYTVLSVLGSGGMGRVYKAWDPALDRPVALKVMLAGRFAARRQIARFLNEAKAVARLDDPTLVAIHDVGLVDECPFFTMEFVDGETLAAVLAVEGVMAPRRAARIAAEIARGLQHAHTQGVVHRDIKPANVLLDADDHARVIDFGIARLLESSADRTRTGQVLGTPAFMAPEQAAGRTDQLGPGLDVYGVGGLLYNALTGEMPRPVSPDTPLWSGEGPPLPRDLFAICCRALAAEPGQRYPTAQALADDLGRYLRGQPVEAALPGPLRRLGWWVRRSRRALLIVGLTALVVTGAIAGAVYWQAERDARRVAEQQLRREAVAAERLDRALVEAQQLRTRGELGRAEQLEADTALRADVQGTRALARFHLARADAAARRGDTEGALGAASTAYAVADAPDEQHGAMVALGRLFVEQRDAPGLASLLATMADRFPERADQRAELELHDRVFAGRLTDAAQRADAAEPTWAPILRALARGTRTPHHLPRLSVTRDVRGPWLADVTGDGRTELWTGQLLLSTAGPDLPRIDWPAPPADLGLDTLIRPIDGMPGSFVTLDRSAGRVLRRDGDRWRTVTTATRLIDQLSVATDLDQDGRPEIYTSTGPGLRTLLPGAGPADPWREVLGAPALEAAQAYLKTIRAARWGEPFLLVGSGGWQAYDMRIYRSAGAGRLALAARRQIGTITDAIVLPDARGRRLIAVSTRSPAVDARLFHPDDDRLMPDGVHIFEWTAAGIEHRTQLTQRTGDREYARMWAGDIDGDGLTDLVTLAVSPAIPRYTVVYRGLPDGWAPPLPLLGFYPFGLVDVDGDGDTELLANDLASGQLWVLGAGETEPPSRPMPAPLPVQAGGSAITDLVALGRLEEALQAWRRELLLGERPVEAARQAAPLAERLGRYEEAAELYLRAAETPTPSAAMLDAAADAGRAARRPTLERAALGRLLQGTDLDVDARARAADRLAEISRTEADRISLDFRQALNPAWRIRMPDRLRLAADAGALDVHADPAGESARLPLRRIGDRVAFELEMQTPRVEFGGGLTAALVATRPGGDEAVLAQIASHGWGGGSLIYHRVFADFGSRGQALLRDARLDGTAGMPVHVYVEFDYRTGETLVIDRSTGRQTKMSLDLDGLGSALALVIRHPNWIRGHGAYVEARITDLTLYGVKIGPPSGDALHVAALALAEARLGDAVDALGDRDEPVARATRAAAHYDRGDWRAADAEVQAYFDAGVDDPVFEQFLIGRLRRDPLHFAPLVRRLRGPRADGLFWRAYGTGFQKHADDPALTRAAAASLIGADDDPTRIVEHPEPHKRLWLWLTRARMRRIAGERGGARADLERAEAALVALPPADDDAAARHRQEVWTDVRIERAALDATHDPRAATEAVRAALAGSPRPAVTADRIRAHAGLRRLREHPVWREIEVTAGR